MALHDTLPLGVGVRVADMDREAVPEGVLPVTVCRDKVWDHVHVALRLRVGLALADKEREPATDGDAVGVRVAVAVGEAVRVAEGAVQLSDGLSTAVWESVRVWVDVWVREQAGVDVRDCVGESVAVSLRLTVLTVGVRVQVKDHEAEAVVVRVGDADGEPGPVRVAEWVGLGVVEKEREAAPLAVPVGDLLGGVALCDRLFAGVLVGVADPDTERVTERVLRVRVAEGLGENVRLGLGLGLGLAAAVNEPVLVSEVDAVVLRLGVPVPEAVDVSEGRVPDRERLAVALGEAVRVWLRVGVQEWRAVGVRDAEREGLTVALVLRVLGLRVSVALRNVESDVVELQVEDVEQVVALAVREGDKEPPGVALPLVLPLQVALRDLLPRGVGVGVADWGAEGEAERELRVHEEEQEGVCVRVALQVWVVLRLLVKERVSVTDRDAVQEVRV